MGSQVTAIEYSPFIGGIAIDNEVSQTLQKILSRQGLNFKMGTKVTGAKKSGNEVIVSVEDAKDPSKKEDISCNALLICIGRKAYTWNLGLEDIGIERDKLGRVPVNNRFQTVIPS